MVSCTLCGGSSFDEREILWPELIEEWDLLPHEVQYINRQQGMLCACGANLRIIALSNAIRSALSTEMLIRDLAKEPWARELQILDLNGASALSEMLAKLPGYTRGDYPLVDMLDLPFQSGRFDLVIHSDTLEHVSDPIAGLGECRRVLTASGRLCFTVPIVVGRLTRDRKGLPKSYHGNPETGADDYAVHTEFGSDAWTYPLKAGFSDVALNAVDFPSAIAITAWTAIPAAVTPQAR
ncbi:methyltransferase domain-containing protein (plasmid) [Aminobacter sp. BA135]|uniref:class I SAM-dependent methyltransferase n=1 Tax=Aminobacter sp. BA135 TaxID=537596 RepID=UPI003D7B824D